MVEDQNKNSSFKKKSEKNLDGIFYIKKERNRLPSPFSDINWFTKNLASQIPKKKVSGAYNIIAVFLLIFLFSILPIRILEGRNNMTAKASESIAELGQIYASLKSNDYGETRNNLLAIETNLDQINTELQDIGQKNNFFSRFSILSDNSLNYERLFNISDSISKLGRKILENTNILDELNVADASKGTDPNLFANLKKLGESLNNMEGEFRSLKSNIESVDENKLSGSEKEYVSLLKNNFRSINNYFYALKGFTEQFPDILGENSDKKYLVLFENNTELRPTGGFMGTYGIITVRDAKIKNIFIDSIYNPDGQLAKKISPPEPLQKINDQLFMRDSNWYPNFPTSAKQISDLYEMEGGFTPDGIIAIDTQPFLDLLDLTGPINLPKYNVELNKDNFIDVTQYKTSIDYDPADKNPKKLLADFAPLFMEKLNQLDKNDSSKVWDILVKNLQQKHIQFYSLDDKTQNIFSLLDIAGEIKPAASGEDYFYYVDTNIGGLKTNTLIKESLIHKIYPGQNNQAIHEVDLTRNHTGVDKGFSGTNFAYLRFYLPLGSKIISINGFEKKDSIQKDSQTGMLYLQDQENLYLGKAEVKDLDISEENGKMVIGIWQVLRPGTQLDSQIVYELPKGINLNSQYSLLVQKQAGVISQNYEIEVPTNNEKIETNMGDACRTENNNYHCRFELVQDKLIQFSFK